MLISTLPNISNPKLIYQMFQHPLIDGVRYNVGTRSTLSAKDTLQRLLDLNVAHKKLWIDLKGRQLRITKWADPVYGEITLNHSFSVDLPATIVYRNGGRGTIENINGNTIDVFPIPGEALGNGQAVNIIGTNLKIDGYLTDQDIEYIQAAKELGLKDFMLSFVENESDLSSVLDQIPDANLVLKIESQPGLAFVKNTDFTKRKNLQLMLARDDLTVNIGDNKADIIPATWDILDKDPQAIAASFIFSSLAHGSISASDFTDLAYLSAIGYHHFMLSDTISHRHFDEAMKLWSDFLLVYGESQEIL